MPDGLGTICFFIEQDVIEVDHICLLVLVMRLKGIIVCPPLNAVVFLKVHKVLGVALYERGTYKKRQLLCA